MDEDKLLLLTEPFFRMAEARERNSDGTGLGPMVDILLPLVGAEEGADQEKPQLFS